MPTNLLVEPILNVATAPTTLPGLLASLSRGDPNVRLSGVRQHQGYAVHTYLVTLAALALVKADAGLEVSPPVEEKAWFDLLSNLTEGHPTAWDLVVSDPTLPAFCQPPVYGEVLKKWKDGPGRTEPSTKDSFPGWSLQRTPDECDIYSTAANHAPKARAMTHPDAEHWVWTLINLQTSAASPEGFHRAATRTGPSGRVYVGFRPGTLDEASWFLRDLAILRSQRTHLLYRYRANGHAVLSLLPWDGNKQINSRDLDPFYLDVARIVRLVPSPFGNPNLMAWTGSRSKKNDLRVSRTLGNTGDIWTPLKTTKNGISAFVTDETGFRYDKIHEIMYGEHGCPPAAHVRPVDGAEPVFYVAGLVLDQKHAANSLGFHERMLPVQPHCYAEGSPEHNRLATKSISMVQAVSVAEDCLREALRQMFPKKGTPPKDQPILHTYIDEYDRMVDGLYFEFLFGSGSQADWVTTLVNLALKILERAEMQLPLTKRIKASALAFNVFDEAKSKQLTL